MTKTLRKKVPVHHDDEQTVERLRTPGSHEALALTEFTGIAIQPTTSEAQVLHALLVAGRKVIEEAALDEAYARQAAYEETHPDVQRWRRAMRGRHLRPFMDPQEHTA